MPIIIDEETMEIRKILEELLPYDGSSVSAENLITKFDDLGFERRKVVRELFTKYAWRTVSWREADLQMSSTITRYRPIRND